MNKHSIIPSMAVLVASGLASAAEPPAVDSAGEPLAADSSLTLTTPAGATFTAPAGWTIETRANMVLLTPPEGDSDVAIVDVQAGNADDAVAAAWEAYEPDFERPLEIALPQAAENGWEQRCRQRPASGRRWSPARSARPPGSG